ncbi:MAG: sulfurtransferase [Dehalococcoidia bacterium]
MEPLVTADWLVEHLDDPELTVLEVSSEAAPAARYFREGHIPGSRFAFWKTLCWDESDREFPTPEEMTRRLGALGISNGSRLVLVGDPIQFATYPYWVLALSGLDHIAAILDGGRAHWVARGLPLTQEEPPTPNPGTVSPRSARDAARVGRDDVRAHLGDAGRVLVDMRTDEEYAGARVSPSTSPFDHGAERAGRIPGARHLYFERLLDGDGRFLPADRIGEQLASVGATPDADVVTYCRLSHRASLGWFAASRLLGWSNVRVYDGSWTEWGSIVGFPVER